MKIRIVDLLKSDIYGIDVYVRGWVRTHRQSKNINFIALMMALRYTIFKL